MATISASTGTGLRAQAQTLESRTKVYEAAAVPQNDIIEMVQMYKGEVVYEVILDYDALGASSSLSVGDGGAAARYIGTTTTTSAGIARITTAADVGRGYKYTSDDTIDVTVVGSGAITGTVRVTVLYFRSF